MLGGPTACCLRRSYRALRRALQVLSVCRVRKYPCFHKSDSLFADILSLANGVSCVCAKKAFLLRTKGWLCAMTTIIFHAQAMLSPEMQREMDEFKREEREAKAESKAEKARVKEEKSPKPTKKATTVKREAATRVRGRARS